MSRFLLMAMGAVLTALLSVPLGTAAGPLPPSTGSKYKGSPTDPTDSVAVECLRDSAFVLVLQLGGCIAGVMTGPADAEVVLLPDGKSDYKVWVAFRLAASDSAFSAGSVPVAAALECAARLHKALASFRSGVYWHPLRLHVRFRAAPAVAANAFLAGPDNELTIMTDADGALKRAVEAGLRMVRYATAPVRRERYYAARDTALAIWKERVSPGFPH